ncbi:hypothetical protein CXB51_004251 [Gossypium anomalum]|uniref:DUF7745 domain-containing protein n=1 Tax=Gossypium anomalum TaxID=47600 RepID=A0A8J5ZEK0_9ROSI|nr:hypothetical protein CXB51_004251 [Gossypium anomalum]
MNLIGARSHLGKRIGGDSRFILKPNFNFQFSNKSPQFSDLNPQNFYVATAGDSTGDPREKGDSLVEGSIANLPEHTTVNVRQNNLEDLVRVWNQWDSDTRGIFTERYGDIAHLITIRVDEQLIQAMVRFWDPAYQCFTFNQEDMTPTIEEYAALLRIDNVQFGKIYVKEPKPLTFRKKLVRLTDMTDAWAEKQIKKKNETVCIPWSSLRELVLSHLDTLKRVNLFALAIYGLFIFPKVLGHIEVAVFDFFERLKQGVNPVPTILAETFRSLSTCRRIGKGRFIGCAQLLNVWIFSHFWKVERTPFHMFSKTFAPLEAYLKKEWPREVTEQHWVSVFQNLRAEDITWRAPWIRPSVLLYKCGGQDWVPYSGYGEELDTLAISPKAIFFATIYTRNWRISAIRVRFRG